MKKVFLISHGLGSNGIDSFVLNVAKGLDKQYYNVYVIMAVDDNGYLQFREQEAVDLGIHVLRTCDLGGAKSKVMHCIKLYQLLSREKPDVVHSNMDLFNGVNMLISWLAHIPIRISHSHTSGSQYEGKSGKHFRVKIYRTIMRKFIWMFSTYLLGCSSLAMEYLYGKKWRDSTTVKILQNGIDIQAFASSEPWKVPTGWTKNKILLTVGRLSDVKNPNFIIEIMRRIDSEYKLIWVGAGELKQEIENQINHYHLENKIKLVGAQQNVAPFYKCADAFIFPSKFEGLPITLVEAQAAGLPCFVSQTITKEVDCGLCEYLGISEKDVGIWTERIETFSRDEFCLNKEKLEKYSIDNMISKLDSLYCK